MVDNTGLNQLVMINGANNGSVDPFRVLIADDDPAVRGLLSLAFQRAGWEVIVAVHGREAVELFEAQGGKFDIVVLDVQMPYLTGTEACAQMHRLRPKLPCLCITGNPDSLTPEAIARLGIREVFYKPFELQTLIGKATAHAQDTRATKGT